MVVVRHGRHKRTHGRIRIRRVTPVPLRIFRCEILGINTLILSASFGSRRVVLVGSFVTNVALIRKSSLYIMTHTVYDNFIGTPIRWVRKLRFSISDIRNTSHVIGGENIHKVFRRIVTLTVRLPMIQQTTGSLGHTLVVRIPRHVEEKLPLIWHITTHKRQIPRVRTAVLVRVVCSLVPR